MSRIPYPPDYDGPIGVVYCSMCGTGLDVDNEAIQDEYSYEFYCPECYAELVAELELEEEFEDDEEEVTRIQWEE